MLDTKKTKKAKNTKNRSLKKRSKSNSFEKNITCIFFEVLLMVKLYHWNTFSYATHKATDDFYSSLNDNMDKFMEVLLGKTNTRIDLKNTKNINLFCVNDTEFKNKIDKFKIYMHSLSNENMGLKMGEDLLNIRDEILADIDKLLYLLTLK